MIMSEGVVVADELMQYIERIENLTVTKKEVADDIKDVYAELKSTGYDTKATRAVIKLRAMERAARQEQEALLDTYKSAVGLD
jgi:uncharacterized protein (UPF0335 family)